MSKKNYNKISTENASVEEVTPVEETVETVEPAAPVVVIGVVTGCKKLNVRTKPNKKSDVVCVIDADTKVEIDEDASSRDFYKVKSKNFTGYCMKKFITIKS